MLLTYLVGTKCLTYLPAYGVIAYISLPTYLPWLPTDIGSYVGKVRG